MKEEQMNDKQLCTIANRITSKSRVEISPLVEKAYSGKALNNTERNQLLKFIEQNQFSNKPMSMAKMKQEVFSIIGYKPSYGGYSGTVQTNTVSRAELEAIYLFLTNKTRSVTTEANSRA